MNSIKQFTFFRNYYEAIKELPNKKEFAFSILEYIFEDKIPEFDGLSKGIWQLMERPLKISKNKANNAKRESNENQIEIKSKSNENQTEIKPKSNENQSHYSISNSISSSERKKEKEVLGEKEKKEEKIHFAEFVAMTNAEYEKLISTYGKEFADQCIVTLDNYKGSSGKKYKSDYRAILSWVVDKQKEKQKSAQAKSSNPFYEIGKKEGIF